MSDLLERGSQWLEDQRHAHMTRMVVYQRGASIVEVAASIGQTVFEQADDYGVIHKTESRDFLIRTADLMLDDEQTLPQAGDRIREAVEGQTFVYEVMAPGSSAAEPPFRYSDPYRRALRIHTKHIATEANP